MLHRVPPHVINEMANLKYFLSADISLAAVVSTQYLCSFLHCFCPVARLACCNQGEQKTHAPFIIATCWADFHLLTCHSLGIRGSEGSYFAKQSTVALYGEVWWRLTNCSFSILASSLLHVASKCCSHFILASSFELAVSQGCDENQITCWGENSPLVMQMRPKKKRETFTMAVDTSSVQLLCTPYSLLHSWTCWNVAWVLGIKTQFPR